MVPVDIGLDACELCAPGLTSPFAAHVYTEPPASSAPFALAVAYRDIGLSTVHQSSLKAESFISDTKPASEHRDRMCCAAILTGANTAGIPGACRSSGDAAGKVMLHQLRFDVPIYYQVVYIRLAGSYDDGTYTQWSLLGPTWEPRAKTRVPHQIAF